MSEVKVHALVLDTNIARNNIWIKIAIQGIEFGIEKVPKNYPLTSLHEITEFTYSINDHNQNTIAQITRGKNIGIILYEENGVYDLGNIYIKKDGIQNLVDAVNKLKKEL